MRAPAEVAGRYRIDRRIGAGGMSTVFLAFDSVLEREVAVKLLAEHLADDEAFVARFRREALSAARLQHPNVVQVFDSGHDEESGRHYIVMEYVRGQSGAELLREHKQLDIDLTVKLVRDACHGLDYAHRAGVVHRDVKPGNLIVSAETGAAKLADFGIAKAADGLEITQAGSVLGTAAYLSPEQAHGEEATAASDIYALGVCTYQFLTGQLPHQYTSLTELTLKQQQDEIRPPSRLRPEVPATLDRVIAVALALDPGDRYENALEMAEAFAAGNEGYDTDATRALTGIRDDTDATRALPVREPAPPPVEPTPPPLVRPEPVRGPERRREPERKSAARRWLANFAILVALATAGGAITYALVSSGGDDIRAITEDEVPSQIDGLRDLINDNAE